MRANSGRSLTIGLLLDGNLWMMGLRGAVSILFGIAVLVWPKAALLAILTLFGIFAIVGGILSIIAAVRGRCFDRYWWLLLIEGILGVAIGCIAFFRPVTTGISLVLLLAIWAIGTGLFQVITAVRLRKVIANEWLLVAAGIASILCGLLFAFWPVAGAVAVVWLIGAYAISFGILLIALTFKLRSWHRDQERLASESDSPNPLIL